MIIGVRTQYNFQQAANALEAAQIITREGGELCALLDKGFLWGSQQYGDAPADWAAAVAAILGNPEFQAAEAARVESLRDKRTDAQKAATWAAATARYAAECRAKEAAVAAANAAADISEVAIIAAIQNSPVRVTREVLCKRIGVDPLSEEAFALARRVAGMVRRGALRQTRVGAFEVA